MLRTLPCRPRLRPLLAALVLAVAPSLPGGAADEAPPFDLEGTWFVLIHYRDSATANPDVLRWQDRVWEFARKGTRLEWTEYPLVVFEDTTGRFEATAGNPRSRVLAPWEPNETQRRTIANGPHVNPRGMTKKSLKGSDAKGWRSAGRRPTVSASVMSYHEELSISGLDRKPVFERRDYVGNAAGPKGGGATRYEVEEISPTRHTLKGRYDRDGIRIGTFRMWRTKPTRGLPESDLTPNEKFQRRAAEAYMEEFGDAEAADDDAAGDTGAPGTGEDAPEPNGPR